MPSPIEQALDALPPLPRDKEFQVLTLPISHLTSARSFIKIVEDGAIEPQHCDVFKRNLLYFSYGGVFHRYGKLPVREATHLPIAFLFSPRLLNQMDCLFPYDTGAAMADLYACWSHQLTQFENYQIRENEKCYKLSKFIYYIYGNNEQYLNGVVQSEFDLSLLIEPLIFLVDFLRADFTQRGTDHRQRIIECQTSQQVNLTQVFDEIVWIGLPKDRRETFYELCQLRNPICPPRAYFYDSWTSKPAPEITAVLEDRAREIITEHRYLSFGA